MIEALNQLAATEPAAWADADPALRTRLHTGLAELLRRLSAAANGPSND